MSYYIVKYWGEL